VTGGRPQVNHSGACIADREAKVKAATQATVHALVVELEPVVIPLLFRSKSKLRRRLAHWYTHDREAAVDIDNRYYSVPVKDLPKVQAYLRARQITAMRAALTYSDRTGINAAIKVDNKRTA
jgi:hypothetical protein